MRDVSRTTSIPTTTESSTTNPPEILTHRHHHQKQHQKQASSTVSVLRVCVRGRLGLGKEFCTFTLRIRQPPYRFLPVATTKPPQSHLQNFIQQLLSSLVEIYRLLYGILYIQTQTCNSMCMG